LFETYANVRFINDLINEQSSYAILCFERKNIAKVMELFEEDFRNKHQKNFTVWYFFFIITTNYNLFNNNWYNDPNFLREHRAIQKL
jgi:hypothetical protein